MSLLFTKNNLTHGYAICGNVESIRQQLFEFIQNEFAIATVGNPDFFHEKFETLTIDDSRRIKEIALGKRFLVDMPRIFILEIYNATREAQNALLKLFEEPEPGNYFFLVVLSFDILLPTLRSRLHLVRDYVPGTYTYTHDINRFLKDSTANRITCVDGIAAAISDGETAQHQAIIFLNDLEMMLYERYDVSHKVATFEAIACARSYMNDRAPSVKMLLEYVALSI
jgi:hypothetical protein